MAKSTKERYKALGLCPCGNARDGDRKKCRRCLDSISRSVKKWKDRHQANGLCRCGQQKISETKCQSCLDRNTALAKKNFLAVLDAYGGRQCACCREAHVDFLTLDHIANDGGREAIDGKRVAGERLYAKLKRLQYPDNGYQILCFNCNLGKARNSGVCPHCDNAEWLDSTVFEGSKTWVQDKLSKRRRFVDTLYHYEGSCACCAEDNPFFLTFDHINGDGAAHRRTTNNKDIVPWIRRNKYPKSIRVLCVNCNSGRHAAAGNECPHKTSNPP